MKYCPNTECWYAVRHREGQEYRDDAMTCADCGAELTATRPVFPPVVAKELPWLRLAATVVVPAVVVGLGPQIPLPCIDGDRFRDLLGPYVSLGKESVFAIGLAPVFSLAWIVELAALCVPRWRTLRTGAPEGRAALLRTTTYFALVGAAVQALGMVMSLEKLGVVVPATHVSRLVIVLSIVAGVAVLLLVGSLLDRIALGGGLAILSAAFAVASVWPLLRSVPGLHPGVEARVMATALLAIVVLSAFVLRWRPSRIPLPACGVVPLFCANAVTIFPPSGWGPALELVATAVFAVGLGFLFNRPSKVGHAYGAALSRVSTAVLYSAGYALALAWLGRWVGERFESPFLSVLPLVTITAAVLDVIAEARAIQQHGELVAVWAEHRLYAVPGLLGTLERHGIPAFARSAHQRALWHFFAPFIPIPIMVPPTRAEEAAGLLRAAAVP